METTDFCSYELSKRLKDCGFDEPCDHYWYKVYTDSAKMEMRQASADDYNNDGWSVPHCSAPLLYHAQKWLREEKNWHIIVEPLIWESLTYEFKLWHKFRGYENANRGFYFSSYERALSAGISASLELIKKGEC